MAVHKEYSEQEELAKMAVTGAEVAGAYPEAHRASTSIGGALGVASLKPSATILKYYPDLFGPDTLASNDSLLHLTKALMEAQGKYEAAKRNVTNQYEHYKYTDLTGVYAAIRGALFDCGIGVLQWNSSNVAERTVSVSTRIVHISSGEWLQNTLVLPAEDKSKGYTAKTIGAAITYGRKYGLKTLAGSADTDDDDVDKNPNAPPPNAQTRKRDAKPAPPKVEDRESKTQSNPAQKSDDKVLTPPERKRLFDDCYSYGGDNDSILEAVEKITGQKSTKLITAGQVDNIKRYVYLKHNPPLSEEMAKIADDVIEASGVAETVP